MSIPKQYKLIANGRYSQIYLDESRSPKVVMKTVDLIAIPKADKLLLEKEVEIHRRLHSPYIVGYEKNYVTNMVQHIVLEYCNQGDLRQQILLVRDKHERFDSEVPLQHLFLPSQQIIEWTFEILQALQLIHSERIIHRDIKPENILLHRGETGRVVCKVADFGLSYQLSDEERSCTTFTGTPLYMAPELVQGFAYSCSVDIWSLGCIVYELCTLRPPFDAEELQDVLDSILYTEYASLPTSCFPQSLIDLVALILNKQSRPSAEELLRLPIFYRFHTAFSAAPAAAISRSDASLPRPVPEHATDPAAVQQPASWKAGAPQALSSPRSLHATAVRALAPPSAAAVPVTVPIVVSGARVTPVDGVRGVPSSTRGSIPRSKPSDRGGDLTRLTYLKVKASQEAAAAAAAAAANDVETKKSLPAATAPSSQSVSAVSARRNSNTLQKQSLMSRYTANRAQAVHPKAERSSGTRSSQNSKKRKVAAPLQASAAPRTVFLLSESIVPGASGAPEPSPSPSVSAAVVIAPPTPVVSLPLPSSSSSLSSSLSLTVASSAAPEAHPESVVAVVGNGEPSESAPPASAAAEGEAYNPSAHPFSVLTSLPIRSEEISPPDLPKRMSNEDFQKYRRPSEVTDLLLSASDASSRTKDRSPKQSLPKQSLPKLEKPKDGYRFNAHVFQSSRSESPSASASAGAANPLSGGAENPTALCARSTRPPLVFHPVNTTSRIAVPRGQDKSSLDLRTIAGVPEPASLLQDDFPEQSFIERSMKSHEAVAVPVARTAMSIDAVAFVGVSGVGDRSVTSRTSNTTPRALEKKSKSFSKSMNVQSAGEPASDVRERSPTFTESEAPPKRALFSMQSSKVARSIPRLTKTSEARRVLTRISGTSSGPVKSLPLSSNSMNSRSRKPSAAHNGSQSQTKSSSRAQLTRTSHVGQLQRPSTAGPRTEMDRIRAVKSNVVKRPSASASSTKASAAHSIVASASSLHRRTVISHDRPMAATSTAPRIPGRSQTKAMPAATMVSSSGYGRSTPISSRPRATLTVATRGGSGGVGILSGTGSHWSAARSDAVASGVAPVRLPNTMPTGKSRRYRSEREAK